MANLAVELGHEFTAHRVVLHYSIHFDGNGYEQQPVMDDGSAMHCIFWLYRFIFFNSMVMYYFNPNDIKALLIIQLVA